METEQNRKLRITTDQDRTRYKDVPGERERGRGKKHEGAEINESREGGGIEESLVFIHLQHCSK